MHYLIQSRVTYIGLVALITLAVLMLPFHAHAQAEFVAKAASYTASYAVGSVVETVVSFLYNLSVRFLAFSATALDWALRLDADPSDTPVVRASWGIVRDFANMFFIIALIITAFATIFDIGSFGYGGYNWQSMLGRFIFAALIINFSLSIR